MPNNWANHRHIDIPIESIVRERKTYPKFKPDYIEEEPDYSINGKRLIDELEESVKFCKREEKIDKLENVFFVIETTKQIEKEDAVFNKQYIFSLQTGPHSAIVSADEQKLETLKRKLQQYSTDSQYKTWVKEIKRISRIKINKFEPELLESFTQDIPIPVEIDLLPNLGMEYNQSIIQRVHDYFVNKEEQVIDSIVDDEIASIRVVARPETVRTVVQGLDSVWKARKTPSLHIDKPQSIKMGQLPVLRSTPSEAKTVCLLDTGVDITHPLLQHTVSSSFDFTPDNDVLDFDGHGTFDAGLAVYGDLEELDKKKSIDATAILINAKVQSKNSIYNNGFLEKRIEAAVEKYHETTHIFSLSIMTEICASLNFPSKLAHTLDNLANEYGVLFVVSAGNIRKGLRGLVRKEPYPHYLQNDCCVIYWGAEACTAITVGGVALKANIRSVAKKEQPSPFTRRGEFARRGKPDVMASGGNLEIDNTTRDLGENDPELGIVSLGLSNEPVAFSKGTSCSAPIIANIVARLSKEYPDASSNLLKALVIHSSHIPDAYHDLNVDTRLKKSVYGKGVPSFEAAAYCRNNAPTLIVEDSVKLDETASIPIFIPKVMRKIAGLRKIKITLVYNPPIDIGVDGYTLVDLDFQLLKQVRPSEFQIQRANWDDSFKIHWDNVKTGTFSWLHSGWGLEWFLKIIPTARFRNRFESKDFEQKYAAVITVEDPTKKIDLYDAMFPIQKTLQKITTRKPQKVPRVQKIQKIHVPKQQELFASIQNSR